MANRNFNRFQALEKEVKALYVQFRTDGGGAILDWEGLGIASVTNPGTGRYLVTLQDKYNQLMSASIIPEKAPGGSDRIYCLRSSDVSSAKEVQFLVQDLTGSPAQIEGTVTVYIRIDVKNSSV